MGLWDDPIEAPDYHKKGAPPEEGLLGRERVLVVVVPSACDWARVCTEHWYRIPLARAPRHIAADYLAFYHPQCLAATRWTVPCYAPVRGYQVLPRCALLPQEADHPRAEQLYYRIEVGALIALPQPIPSPRLRRITFIETTLERLLQAREVNDLWLHQSPGLGRQRALRLGEAMPARGYATA